VIAGDHSCTLASSVEGYVLSWGNYEAGFNGELSLGSNARILGEVALRLITTNLDTMNTIATFSGQFDLNTASVTGTWTTIQDAPFTASGHWGCMKQ
jgi:hypothetical protein